MSISVDYHESIGVIQISIDGQAVFLRREDSADLLSKFMHVLATTIPAPEAHEMADADNWSRKVPDTPGLRLVGAFECNPDESGGAA